MNENNKICKSPYKINQSYINYGWGAEPIDFEPPAILYNFSEMLKRFIKKYLFFFPKKVYFFTQPGPKIYPAIFLLSRGV